MHITPKNDSHCEAISLFSSTSRRLFIRSCVWFDLTSCPKTNYLSNPPLIFCQFSIRFHIIFTLIMLNHLQFSQWNQLFVFAVQVRLLICLFLTPTIHSDKLMKSIFICLFLLEKVCFGRFHFTGRIRERSFSLPLVMEKADRDSFFALSTVQFWQVSVFSNGSLLLLITLLVDCKGQLFRFFT